MTNNLTKRELINQVADKLGANDVKLNKKQIEVVIGQIFDAIKSEISENGKCNINSFGTFEIRNRKERPGRSPKDGKPITIAASKSVGLKVSNTLKTALNA
jgi:DNA-binding protein HU-beta